MIEWGDIRYFVAVARAGSTAAAARTLGVDATTVARRIAALERVLGQQLFERRPDGYRLASGGEDLLIQAGRVAAEVEAFQDLADGQQRRVGGRIRVTGTEVMVTYLLGPAIFRMRKRHPSVKAEVVVDDRRLDLVRGEADVALRVGATPSEPSLVARRMPDSCWTLYCSRSYAAAHGAPTMVEELDRHVMIAGEGPLAKVATLSWLEEAAPSAEVVCRANTIPNLISLVQAGVGISMLPCLAGESDPELIRCLAPPSLFRSELWLLYHESQRRSAAVRAFVDSLAEEVLLRKHLLDPREACELEKSRGDP